MQNISHPENYYECLESESRCDGVNHHDHRLEWAEEKADFERAVSSANLTAQHWMDKAVEAERKVADLQMLNSDFGKQAAQLTAERDRYKAALELVRAATGAIPKHWQKFALLELNGRIFDTAHETLGCVEENLQSSTYSRDTSNEST